MQEKVYEESKLISPRYKELNEITHIKNYFEKPDWKFWYPDIEKFVIKTEGFPADVITQKIKSQNTTLQSIIVPVLLGITNYLLNVIGDIILNFSENRGIINILIIVFSVSLIIIVAVRILQYNSRKYEVVEWMKYKKLA